jgi:hypothetical protein
MLLETVSTGSDHGPREVDVFGVRGVFDEAAGRRVTQRILDLAGQGRRAFVIDLAGADDVDSSALTPVLTACARLEPDGGRISVVMDSRLTVFGAPGREALYDVAVTREDGRADPPAVATRITTSRGLRYGADGSRGAKAETPRPASPNEGGFMATTATTRRKMVPAAKTRAETSSLEYVERALEDLEHARQQATREVRADIDDAAERLRHAVGDLGDRVQEQLSEFEHMLDRAGNDLRRELARRAIRAQRTPEALTELAREVRKRKAELAA